MGLPRADYYFEKHDTKKLRDNFNKKYNLNSNKKIILYAPTFRENKEFNNVFNYLDIDEFNKKLSDEYILVLRLHPKIKEFYSSDITGNGDYIDCSDYKNEQELLLLSDILITDYSSIMIEDLPGPIVFSTDELISAIDNGVDTSKLDSFVKMEAGAVDGNSSKRIVDFVLNEGEKNG